MRDSLFMQKETGSQHSLANEDFLSLPAQHSEEPVNYLTAQHTLPLQTGHFVVVHFPHAFIKGLFKEFLRPLILRLPHTYSQEQR